MSISNQSLNFRQLQQFFSAVALLMMSALAHAAPALFFSDLDSGPNAGGENNKGAYVTIWGTGFGAARGTSTVTVGGGAVDNYVFWTDTKVIFQLGPATASGTIVLTSNGQNSNGIPFVVRPGTIYFVAPDGNGNGQSATPMSPTAVYNAIAPGVIFYFRQGTYTAQYGQFAWGDNAFVLGSSKKGTPGSPVAFVGYPGEVPTFSGRPTFGLRDSSETVADYITIADLRMIGTGYCINGGARTPAGGEVAKSGAKGIRVVGNVFSATYDWNTMSGLISIGADGWRVYGNEFKDTGTTPPINNNHTIYVQVGSSDIDIGWNYLHDLRMGHLIQVHTDTPFLYQDVRIHDNLITAATSSDSRGISVGETLPGSYGTIYNNVLSNLGQNYSAIFLYSGSWKIFNNTFHNIRAPASSYSAAILIKSTGTAEVRNNIFHVDSQSVYVAVDGGASMSQFTLSNNLYYGNGNGPAADTTKVNADPLFANAAAGNFRLQASSPAIDRGTSAVSAVVTRDRDGGSRPYAAAFDIGAYEYGASPAGPTALPAPRNLRSLP